MLQQRRGEREDRGSRIPARERLERLIEARRAFLAGDVEDAIGAYAKLLDPAKPHPTAILDVRRILIAFDQVAALDSEFGHARVGLRKRITELLSGCG